MKSLFSYKSPTWTEFESHPLKPFTDFNLSLFDDFFEGVFHNSRDSFLPYNTIAVDENNYLIEVAMAGFSKDDFVVSLDGNELKIASKCNGATPTGSDNTEHEISNQRNFPQFLHHGIAKRYFSLQFTIPKYSEVSDVSFKDGLLSIKVTKPEQKDTEPKILKVK